MPWHVLDFLKVYFMCLSSHMKTNPSRTTLLFILLLAVFGIAAFQFQPSIARQGLASATPTYDPLAEPPLPPNPTELDLGRNLYWHWCMPCHGDKGQGLTDEFRGVWEPDHQNCWARGCHAGRRDDEGFPIPTIVPGLVDNSHLVQFSSLQEFSDFLKATHPPQSPGVLKDEEYRVIALFVFAMNGRTLADVAATPVFTSTETPVPSRESTASPYFVSVIVSLIVLMVIIFVLIRKNRQI
jgi:hypothetical protein